MLPHRVWTSRTWVSKNPIFGYISGQKTLILDRKKNPFGSENADLKKKSFRQKEKLLI
jgi:hypothetical protein